MRTTLLVAVSILAVAFAGCTDEPPTGEFSSSGNALMMTGAVASFESQDFNNPYPQTEGTLAECAQDPQAQPPVQACERPYTVMTLNLSSLPATSGKIYSVKWYSMATGAQQDLDVLSGMDMPADGTWMANEYTFDNTADCAASKDSDMCNKANTYDSVVLYLDDILVASAPLSTGAAFEFDEGLLGASFTGSYSGKDLTLTVSGLGNYTYEAWLISTDDAGVVTHEEKFTVVNGENTFTASQTINKFSGVHIHVAGTKLNVAVASL